MRQFFWKTTRFSSESHLLQSRWLFSFNIKSLRFSYFINFINLARFTDIDYSEEVDFLPGFEVSEEEVKSFLIDIATQPF